MSTATSSVPAPTDRRLSPRRPVVWYGAFAGYAGAVWVFSAGNDRVWGAVAAIAYAVAALVAVRWRDAALVVSVVGGLVAPLGWLATRVPATPDVQVVARSAALLLHHGTPYLPAGQVVGSIDYNPYLPVMAVFGLPRAVGVPGPAGDTRVWLCVATLVLFTLAFRIAGRPDGLRSGLFAVASPVVAFPLALGITDPPVLALVCLAVALLGRTSAPVWLAAVLVGVVCAMKATAWPALPVLVAMLAARDGARVASRFTAVAVGTTVVLVAPFAGSALVRNTVLFPLGLTGIKTPAASPLPGHLLAMLGPAGQAVAVGLLIAVGVAVAVWIVVRPPRDGRAAVARLAVGLAMMFALSPATRFGYFAYPVGLWGWLVLSSTVDTHSPEVPA
ncbi:MAG TPA: glycosyltransferase family 87 protein [Pseudonocardiaceae bacterium]